jgi:hypothetical protein
MAYLTFLKLTDTLDRLEKTKTPGQSKCNNSKASSWETPQQKKPRMISLTENGVLPPSERVKLKKTICFSKEEKVRQHHVQADSAHKIQPVNNHLLSQSWRIWLELRVFTTMVSLITLELLHCLKFQKGPKDLVVPDTQEPMKKTLILLH